MAVLNIRVDDAVRDQLKELADVEGATLSEYVRDLLLEVIVPVHEQESRHGDVPAPESMRIIDRKMLSMLHRILARVLPEDANDVDGDIEYQLDRAKVLEQGFTGEYWMEVAGFSTELSQRDCNRVSDILQMFRVITLSIGHLKENGAPVSKDLSFELEFRGFDHNDALEGQMAAYVEYQMRDDDHWTELRPQLKRNDNGNSHARMLDTYMRMLTEYRRIKDGRKRGGGFSRYSYLLTGDELQLIAEAQVHPSNRRSAEQVDPHLA